MASRSTVNEDELKRKTGEFDLEAISFLDLSEQGLHELGVIPLCVSLRVLDLSCNQLADVRALASLVSLEELDLSNNHISSLQNFDRLEKLKTLDLPGNDLSQLESLLPLCGLPDLLSLCLQLPDTALTNPLCSCEQYTVFVSQRFPNLRWLDGERGEGGDRERQGEGGGGDVRRERRELEWQLKQLEAIGSSSTNGRAEAPDTLVTPSLNDEQAMAKIKNLLSECSNTSQRVQDHIDSLQRELLH